MITKKEQVCYESDSSGLKGSLEKVVFPKSNEDVQKIINSGGFDIVPRGAGSGLEGGCVPNNSIVVDLSKMNKTLSFDLEKMFIYVEAGITIRELNEKLAFKGFEFPIIPDNNGISTIGGMIATNACGKRSMKYGLMREWVEELCFISGRGELVRLSKTDLMDVCGMEGITGIIVSAKLRIIPAVKRSISVFKTDDFREALSIVRRLKLEKEISMLQLFSKQASKLMGFSEDYHLIIEFDSERGKIKGERYEFISKLRDKIYYNLFSLGYLNLEDPKFFFDKLEDFILFLEENKILYFGYLGMGIIHPFFKDNDKSQELVVDFIKKSKARLGKFGIGIRRKSYLDDSEKNIIKRVKLRHDPFFKLNKGKIIDFEVREIEREKIKQEGKIKIEPLEKKEIEEIRGLVKNSEFSSGSKVFEGEKRSAEQIIKEVKNSSNEKEKTENKEIRDKIADYEFTYDSELQEDRKRDIEEFARNVSKEVVNLKQDFNKIDKKFDKQELKDVNFNSNSSEYNGVKTLMEDRFGFEMSDDVNEKLKINDFEKQGRVTENEKSIIDSVMFNKSNEDMTDKKEEKNGTKNKKFE